MGYRLTDFEKSVLEKLKSVPRGKVTTYALLAAAVGRPKAARAVGNALNKNPFAPRVPCHRVVKSGGRVGGYARGIDKKIALLRLEGARIVKNAVAGFKEKVFNL